MVHHTRLLTDISLMYVSLNLISLLACLCYASERYRELQVCSGSQSDSRTQQLRPAADVGWIYLYYLWVALAVKYCGKPCI